MQYQFDARSLRSLARVHPDLRRIVHRALELSAYPLMVVEGRRRADKQRQLVRAGKASVLDSRHVSGHAVDIVAVQQLSPKHSRLLFNDGPAARFVTAAMLEAARQLAIELECGVDFAEPDPHHFELPHSIYPARAGSTARKDHPDWGPDERFGGLIR